METEEAPLAWIPIICTVIFFQITIYVSVPDQTC